MKKFLLSLSVLVSSFYFCAAQFSMNQHMHNPDYGDAYDLIGMDTSGITEPPGGAGITWAYPTLNANSNNSQLIFDSPDATPFGNFFPNARIASQFVGNNTYGYYKQKADTFLYLGLTNPDSSIINFTDNMYSLIYPFAYNDSLADSSFATYYDKTLDDSVDQTGYTKVKAIGYGTLELPFDTFNNTLLVKRYEEFTTEPHSFPTTTTIETTQYGWYISSFDHWIFSISKTYTYGGFFTDTTKTVQVVDPGPRPTDTIAGRVLLPNNNPVTDGTVIAYEVNASGQIYQIADADVTLDANGNYSLLVHSGQYILLAIPDDQTYSGVMPTYLANAYRWSKANEQAVSGNMTGVDIVVRNKPPLSGQGIIKGKVVEGSTFDGLNKQFTEGDPLSNINCSVVDAGSDSVFQVVKTAANGSFYFDSLPAGNYDIRAEVPGVPVDTGGMNDFDISAGGTTHNNILVKVDSDRVFVTKASGIGSKALRDDHNISVYPNPAQNYVLLSIKNNTELNKNLKIQLFDITGQQVASFSQVNFFSGKNKIRLPLDGVPSGLLMIRVSSAKGNNLYHSKFIHLR